MKRAFTFTAIVVCLLLALPALADDVKISDLTEGVPSIQVFSGGADVTVDRVTILGDSGAEYLHFQLALGPNQVGDGSKVYGTLLEYAAGQVSDTLAVAFLTDQHYLEVWFASDPATLDLTGFTGGIYPTLVEDGTYQLLGWAFNTQIGDGGYSIYVQSDTEVPEPTSLVLLGSGLIGLAGRLRKRLSA
jgi:hypothetical protein